MAHNTLKIYASPVIVVVGHDSKTGQDWVEIDDDTDRIAPDAGLWARLPTYYEKYRGSVQDIIIEAAPHVRYGNVMRVMDAACGAGFYTFGLANSVAGITQPPGAPPGFQKELPRCGKRHPELAPSLDYKHDVVVEVSAADKVWIGRHRTTSAQIYDDMRQALHLFRPLPHISLVADVDASWQTIISVLDAARQAGDDDVGFVTQ